MVFKSEEVESRVESPIFYLDDSFFATLLKPPAHITSLNSEITAKNFEIMCKYNETFRRVNYFYWGAYNNFDDVLELFKEAVLRFRQHFKAANLTYIIKRSCISLYDSSVTAITLYIVAKSSKSGTSCFRVTYVLNSEESIEFTADNFKTHLTEICGIDPEISLYWHPHYRRQDSTFEDEF